MRRHVTIISMRRLRLRYAIGFAFRQHTLMLRRHRAAFRSYVEAFAFCRCCPRHFDSFNDIDSFRGLFFAAA